MPEAHKYRPDIDGLRAIAVVAVLIYHLNKEWLPGGFVGVDVFFVISGYLITGLVRRELLESKFSFRAFYLRRIRRLWPALAAVTLVTVAFAFFVLLPRDFHSLSKSVLAQPLALQNISFMVEGEYFLGSETKPLLHTWSLGVEEQFYLVWPALLALATKRGWRTVLAATILLSVGSFVGSLLLMPLSPKASFFLLPPRAWELGVGAGLAILEERVGRRWLGQTAGQLAGLLGLLAVLAGCIVIDSTMAFPGFVAAIPVFGTALLIVGSGSSSGPVTAGLKHPSMVYIGRLSYSLYLWHWPVIVFAKHLGVFSTDSGTVVALTLISMALAAASYELVEKTIRRGRLLPSSKGLLIFAGLSASLTLASGYVGLRTQGADFRYDGASRAMLTAYFDAERDRCGFIFRVTNPRDQVCDLHRASRDDGAVLLWGNSHADMWSGALRELAARYDRSLYLNARNCRPTTDSSFCNGSVQAQVLEAIKQRQIDSVVLASSWRGAYKIADEVLIEQLEAVVDKLAKLGVRVFLVVDVPADESFDPQAQYLMNPRNPEFGSIPIDAFESKTHAFEKKMLAEIADRYDTVTVIDPRDVYCYDGQRCYAGRGDEAWFHDSGHLTNAGAMQAAPLFESVFQ